MLYAGRWKSALVAIKLLSHRGKGGTAHAVVAREAVISAATAHPNVVGHSYNGIILISEQAWVSAILDFDDACVQINVFIVNTVRRPTFSEVGSSEHSSGDYKASTSSSGISYSNKGGGRENSERLNEVVGEVGSLNPSQSSSLGVTGQGIGTSWMLQPPMADVWLDTVIVMEFCDYGTLESRIKVVWAF